MLSWEYMDLVSYLTFQLSFFSRYVFSEAYELRITLLTQLEKKAMGILCPLSKTVSTGRVSSR